MDLNEKPIQKLFNHLLHFEVKLYNASLLMLVGLCIGFLAGKIIYTNSSDETALSIDTLASIDRSIQPDDSNDSFDTSTLKSEEVCVEVAGAVMMPGVFCFEKGKLVVDALARAGEYNFDSYAYKYVSRRVNLARPLVENEKIYIPFMDDVVCETVNFAYVDKEIEVVNSPSLGVTEGKEPKKPSESVDMDDKEDNSNQDNNEEDDETETPDSDEDCISINSATIAELTTISGIGNATAQKIIDARPFTALDQLLDVNGIGDAKYQTLLEYVCL